MRITTLVRNNENKKKKSKKHVTGDAGSNDASDNVGAAAAATTTTMQKALRGDANTALAVVRRSKNFRPAADPFPGAQDGQNLISWRWTLLSLLNPVWRRSMHAISSYRGNRPTNKQTNKPTNKHTNTHTHTDRTDYNTLRR